MIRAIAAIIVEVLFFGACLFGAAGSLAWAMAWVVIGIYALLKAAALVFLDPELIRERVAPGPGVDRGDVALATLGVLALYPVTFIVAGLDAVRFGPYLPMATYVQIAGLFVYVVGYGFAYWAVFSNPFFATFVRIQEDRGHVVVSTGPYALVRHPGYAGVLAAHLALPFALESIWTLLPTALATLFFVARTSREDRTLRDNLPGYREYQDRVRWRLVPGVW
ncbi:MAG: isoprenylcysteine carboxylmethyltransferase family protein [Gammaproteobacteria bacterium]|nr:isoprenylcysteine carboxylmethyltransferase family protein [Gammaproteobacteria bacterium]